MEETFAVKPFGVKYICNSCKKGEMLATDKIKMHENHIEYTHKCSNCEAEMDLKEKYPLI